MLNGSWFSLYLTVSAHGGTSSHARRALALTETLDRQPRTHELNHQVRGGLHPSTWVLSLLAKSNGRNIFFDIASFDGGGGLRAVFDFAKGEFIGFGKAFGGFAARTLDAGAEPLEGGWYRLWEVVEFTEPMEDGLRVRLGPHGTQGMAPHYVGTRMGVLIGGVAFEPLGAGEGEGIEHFLPEVSEIADLTDPQTDEAELPKVEPPKVVESAPPLRRNSRAGGTPSREQPPDLAFICSHGRTSTRWLAQVLNLHPDVTCAHGGIVPPFIEKEGFSEERYGSVQEEERRRMFAELSVSNMVKTMWRETDSTYTAWIHAISIRNLVEKLKAERFVMNVTVSAFVRHPVVRANSYWKHFLGLLETEEGRARADLFRKEWSMDNGPMRYVDAVHKEFPKVDFGSFENMFFVMAVRSLGLDYFDLQCCYPIFRMEDVIAEEDYFVHFLRTVFRPNFPVTRDYLDRVKAHPVANFTTKPSTPEQVFKRWKPWQRHCFRVFMEFQGNEINYGAQGYDLSFL